ncbi:hypothetical protein V6N11_069869 [Hibiscus sabdariffa]|uniref:Uncharacterized protein n=1 Tax=Hibiscus sabdariffa TaxID=183260 RepID=A0ABR2Q432_9ROSI
MPPKGMVQLGNVSVLERPSSPVALEDQRLAKKDKNDAVREDPLEVEVEGNQENTNSGTSKGFAGDISKNNSGKDTCLGDKVKSTYVSMATKSSHQEGKYGSVSGLVMWWYWMTIASSMNTTILRRLNFLTGVYGHSIEECMKNHDDATHAKDNGTSQESVVNRGDKPLELYVSSFTKNDACKASNPNKRAESGKGKKKDGRGVEIVPLLENAQTKTMVYSVVAKNGKHRPCRLWKGGSSKRFR